MNGVIVTGMEMPDCCAECVIKDCCTSPYRIVNGIDNKFEYCEWKRAKDCHLKSVEGLIEKINEMKPFDNDKDKVVWIDAKPVPMVCLSDVIEIIKEYCEVTE